MATSPYKDVEFILDFLGRLIWDKPARILDVGDDLASGFTVKELGRATEERAK